MVQIKKVSIKNVRGLGNEEIELNMFPNKPSLLVAPNGTGKTSFALAFDGLKPRSYHIDEEEIFNNVSTNEPELILETEDSIYRANSSVNEISRKFSVFVINNQNKPQSVRRTFGGHTSATSHMEVAPIVLIDKLYKKVEIEDTFKKDCKIEHFAKGTIPSINPILEDCNFMSDFDSNLLKVGKITIKLINEFIEKIRAYTGTKKNVWENIQKNDLSNLKTNTKIESVVKCLEYKLKKDTEVLLYLKAVQLIKLYEKNSKKVEEKILYSKGFVVKESYKGLFETLKKTWKNVAPKIEGDKYIVEIKDTSKLSNGERDIIVFLAMLQRAKNVLTKTDNILIIDEIFDYLDDANLIAAQYYITQYIEEIKKKGKTIFPIILSHLNPGYFKSYAFKDLKVYYLKKHKPMYSHKMEILLTRRKELEEQDKKNHTETDLISKYMLHFHPDYSINMTKTFAGKSDLNPWKDVNVFKKYCKEETTKYINKEDYDSVAICVYLREVIEHYLYDKIPSDKREEFIGKHGTNNKIIFAEENRVDCPEIFCLLGLIYNDNLHIKEKSQEDSRETLYSRLENDTIRNMIKSIVERFQY